MLALAEDDDIAEPGESIVQQEVCVDMDLQDDLESEDEVVAAAAAAAAAPSRRRLKRQASITFDNVNDFIVWFIDDQGLKTIADYNKEILNSLERHSSKVSPLNLSKFSKTY